MKNINRQSGVVLVTSLVLLTVLTLIGVASMSSSTLEMKASGNAQQRNAAFEAGQQIIDIAASLNDTDNTNDYQTFVSKKVDAGYEQLMFYTPAGQDIEISSITTWDGCGPKPGSSLEQGKALVMNSFSVRATGKVTTGSATSVQLQGVRFPAADCPAKT